MKKSALMLLFAVSFALMAADEALIPWATNSSQFRSTIIVNNLNPEEAEVFLVATRANGDEEAALRTIAPFGQLVEATATLFPVLGDGPGYRVLITANLSIDTGFVVSSTGSQSGNSPAQADAFTLDDAGGPGLLFNYLPVTPGAGASAPVVVNAGTEDASVVFHAWQGGALVSSSAPVTVPAGRPYAEITSNLFPGVTGNIFVIAESDQPMLGMAFIFNASLEPSMAGARVLGSLPQP